jgi:hypothetical protein
MLVITSHQIATELLAGRGHIYSGRPYFPMAMGEVGLGSFTTVVDYGPTFREHRKMFHRFLEGQKAYKFTAHIESETLKFISNLYKRPEAFLEHIRG